MCLGLMQRRTQYDHDRAGCTTGWMLVMEGMDSESSFLLLARELMKGKGAILGGEKVCAAIDGGYKGLVVIYIYSCLPLVI